MWYLLQLPEKGVLEADIVVINMADRHSNTIHASDFRILTKAMESTGSDSAKLSLLKQALTGTAFCHFVFPSLSCSLSFSLSLFLSLARSASLLLARSLARARARARAHTHSLSLSCCRAIVLSGSLTFSLTCSLALSSIPSLARALARSRSLSCSLSLPRPIPLFRTRALSPPTITS